MEQKQEFKLSGITKFKAHLSTGLLIFGGVAMFMAKTPEVSSVGLLCLIYSYMVGLDARMSAHEELMKSLMSPSTQNESNG